jgi:hypothetical protein
MEVLWNCLRITSSRPYGTFRLLNFYPGLASWAKFSRPYGTRIKFYSLMLFQYLLDLFLGNRQMILILLQP